MPLNVTAIARACGLSRGTVLYYEQAGLLRPARRSAANYRVYTAKELDRLRQICAYRAAGLTLRDIGALLEGPSTGAADVLKRRLAALGEEIERLRSHQRAIARLLGGTHQLRRLRMVTKEKWVEIMRAAGFTDGDMHRWHAEFEKAAPQEHQEFLEFLHIPPQEVNAIREWSRRAARD